MAAAPQPAIDAFTTQLLAGSGMDIKDAQRVATKKQYTIELGMNVRETDGNKAYFQGFPVTYIGVPYAMVVVVEAAFIELFAKLNQAAKEIATGGEAPPA